MSDEARASTPAEAPANPVVANAAQALAIKELGETIAGVRKQVKMLWIGFVALAVVTAVVAALTFVPSLRFGAMGGNRGTFQRGTNGAPGTFQGAPGMQDGGAPDQGTTQP